ncbi:MAG TPA: phytanoyl-CoA dioxygenase family protein, partial [Acidimicrobiales bacterium]|nr:phytanoyl-CoA dioxygenase family protein [Acidimicrobiales bacterium]
VEQLRSAVGAAREHERQRGQEHDLLDPQLWPKDDNAAALEPGKGVGFLFNLWLWEPAFRSVAFSPTLARWAAQLVGARQVRVLEDNVLFKEAHRGGELRWHQDYSYWPLAQPNAVTMWIALDDVSLDNGAVRFAAGSHLLGERLPAIFGTGTTYLREGRSPLVGEIGDPDREGMPVRTMTLVRGEVSAHHAMTWHASGGNDTDRPRRAYVVRYLGDGTIWLGERRYAFNYTDEQLGLAAGDAVSGPYFPVVPF